MESPRVRVLFVCLGNICRSPTAEGVFRSIVRGEGLARQVQADSAGTAAYHLGSPPDSRSRQAASQRGYDLSSLRARQVELLDFTRFDLVLAMDRQNLAELERSCPRKLRSKVRLFLEFASSPMSEVPDPYYGGASGFDDVLDLVEEGSAGLLEHLRREHEL